MCLSIKTCVKRFLRQYYNILTWFFCHFWLVALVFQTNSWSSLLLLSLFLWISIYLSVLSVYFSAHMPRTLTYSPCVPYADTISYKFHLLIFLKNILILSVIPFLSVIRFRNWIESSQIRCSLSFVIILNVTLKPNNNNNNNDGKRRDRDRGEKI